VLSLVDRKDENIRECMNYFWEKKETERKINRKKILLSFYFMLVFVDFSLEE
jgi:hypothetical protein